MQKRWLELSGRAEGREGQEELYRRQFAEPFARLFAELPLHGAPDGMPRPRALVSVLGFSWQPVALMAAWGKPERLLILGTKESLAPVGGDEEIPALVARIAGIPRGAIEVRPVDDPAEGHVYREVRDFLQRCVYAPREVFVDPTGGKKSMSAAAALAAFLVGAPLVYVDNGEYRGRDRIPVPGTEYPRLLTNPLEFFGELDRRAIFEAFNRSDFDEAGRLADQMAQRLYEPREAECLAALAKAYAAWDEFKFKDAGSELRKAGELLERFSTQGRWSWADGICKALEENLRALDAISTLERMPDSIEAGVPLLAWYIAKARRLRKADKRSPAILLAYAAMERYINLCLWVGFRLNDESPDYSTIQERIDWDAYHRNGQKLHGNSYRNEKPHGPLTLASGAQLLATLSPERLSPKDFEYLKGLMSTRNKCEYEHGFLPKHPKPESVTVLLDHATRMIALGCGGAEEFERKIAACQFPTLRDRLEDVT
ncbi:MAG: hypothetical protein ACUVYA_01545 [Planctomycetota bacterium]